MIYASFSYQKIEKELREARLNKLLALDHSLTKVVHQSKISKEELKNYKKRTILYCPDNKTNTTYYYGYNGYGKSFKDDSITVTYLSGTIDSLTIARDLNKLALSKRVIKTKVAIIYADKSKQTAMLYYYNDKDNRHQLCGRDVSADYVTYKQQGVFVSGSSFEDSILKLKASVLQGNEIEEKAPTLYRQTSTLS